MCVCVFSLSCCCWSLSLYYKFNLPAGNDSGEYRSQAVQSFRVERGRESASGAVKSCRSAHSRRDRRHTSPIKRRRSFSTSKCAGLTSRAARTERFVRTQPEEGGGKKERKARNSMVSGARKELHTSLLMMSFWKLFSLSTERHADLTLTNDRFLFSLLPLMSRLLCVTPSLMAITAAG